MVESGGEPAPSWTSGVDGHGTVLAFSWLPWPLDEIKSRRDGPRTGNRHFILKKVKFYSRSRKKVTVLNLFYKGAVNAYFLTGSFFKKTVVFEAAIFVGQPEDGAEVRCEVSRRVEPAVSRYSGPSGLRFMVCPARRKIIWFRVPITLIRVRLFTSKYNKGPGARAGHFPSFFFLVLRLRMTSFLYPYSGYKKLAILNKS